VNARQAVERFLAAVDELDDPAIFITIGSDEQLFAWADEIDGRLEHDAPLRGLVFAVKDNIDVASMPTTAGCPAYAYVPTNSAPVVHRLLEVGAIPVAKTNLDQFATGLVGTRSPYGTPRHPVDPLHVPGGSSSGSAVAVARDLVDFALGTDTAGSGRVPAGFCGVIGTKPTVGRLPTLGVVPAVRSLDCVSIFSRDLDVAADVLNRTSGFLAADPFSRKPPTLDPDVPSSPTFGVLNRASLGQFGADDATIDAYLAALGRLSPEQLVEVDFGPFAAAGDLLYDGPWVAERTSVVGDFIAANPHAVDPTVASIVRGGVAHSAVDAYQAGYRLAELRREVEAVFDRVDVIVLPTTPHGATLDDVERDPVGVNARLGRFTTFANLLDLAALSIPMPSSISLPFGITLYGVAWSESLLFGVASALFDEDPVVMPASVNDDNGRIRLAVAGAHLKGQPLEYQLTDLGAAWEGSTSTASSYRLYALPGGPPEKPGLVFDADGTSIEVDVWALSPEALGTFLSIVPPPLALGTVTLSDGSDVTGFVCEPRALDGAVEVTHFGGWRSYVGEVLARDIR
jgi:allophanate hydrolase